MPTERPSHNEAACKLCEIEAIYGLWAAAIRQYWIDLRAAYRYERDPYGTRQDFERDCFQLENITRPVGLEWEVVREHFRQRLTREGLGSLAGVAS